MAAPHPSKARVAGPWQWQDRRRKGPTLPSAWAGEPHSFHSAGSHGQVTVPALGPARLRATVAHATNAHLPGGRGDSATRQHHAALCPASPRLRASRRDSFPSAQGRMAFPSPCLAAHR